MATPSNDIKVCTTCGIGKNTDQYAKGDIRNKGGLRSRCKPCTADYQREYMLKNANKFRELRREKHYLNKYGITYSEYITLCDQAANCCQICSQEGFPAGTLNIDGDTRGHRGVLSLDHDHVTGSVRGILCVNCNLGIGNLKENIDNLSSAIKYLKQYKRK